MYNIIIKGISGRFIKYDPKTQSYLIDPSLRLNRSVKDITLIICELGWLYGKVDTYLKIALKKEVFHGLVVQAFGFALQVNLVMF